MPRETNSFLERRIGGGYLVRSVKKEAAQDGVNHANLGDEELSNTLQFKYFGVIQAADGDLLALSGMRGNRVVSFQKSDVHLDRIQGMKKSQTTSVPSYKPCCTALSLGK